MPQRLKWSRLLSTARPIASHASPNKPKKLEWIVSNRTETERDFDRVLYSTPFRRLADKTQVFPLEQNDSVRTRLTHSIEVANLARSIGTHLVHSEVGQKIVDDAQSESFTEADIKRAIPAMLGAIGLAHDLGNPPFGHQGEESIRSWIKSKSNVLFERVAADPSEKVADLGRLTARMRADFENFEGNAQALRTVTRLQVVRDTGGLNLTYGTLAALMKYSVPSDAVDPGRGAAWGKPGYFESEADLVKDIHERTGLENGLRHPLTWIMEACDDVAYSIIDAEDAVKKRLVSFPDLIHWLDANTDADELSSYVIARAKFYLDDSKDNPLSPWERNDVCVQRFRAEAMTAIVSSTILAFEQYYDDIMNGDMKERLITVSRARSLVDALKKFDLTYAYRDQKVLELELRGNHTLHALMDALWVGISQRAKYEVTSDGFKARRGLPFAQYAYGRISENYRRVFEADSESLPIRYRELRLLTDMVSGMTDGYALELKNQLADGARPFGEGIEK